MQQGYHFPPPDPEPAYGYGGQQLMPAQQQWGQPQPDPRAYELAYQTYAPGADFGPSPFQAPPAHAQQQGYGGEMEPEYSDDYYEDEEPRRGKRWLLITVALVGAIGVGGALAYGYRSFIAGHPGRVPVVKADANVKAKPDFRGGKDFAGAERRPPVRISDDAAPEPAASAEEPPAENQGPRVVKSIPIAPGGVVVPHSRVEHGELDSVRQRNDGRAERCAVDHQRRSLEPRAGRRAEADRSLGEDGDGLADAHLGALGGGDACRRDVGE